jgi:signal transduction histidine kinase/CheY-like chemotaxis protein
MPGILIVDNQPLKRAALGSLLDHGAHQLLEASSGDEALAIARIKSPDLILAEVNASAGDMYAFVVQLRDEPALAHTAILFYSAAYYAQAISERAATSKPRQLCDTIQVLLGAAPAPDPQAKRVRLQALIDFNVELAAEGDPQRLIERVCRAAKTIIGAEYAAIGIVDGGIGPIMHDALVGADAEMHARAGLSGLRAGLLGQLLEQRRPCRLGLLDGDSRAIGFAPGHPPIYSLLAVPFGTPAQVYGWLYLANKHAVPAFDDRDQQFVLALAAQAATAYENATRGRLIQRYVHHLERSTREFQEFIYIASHDLQEPLRKVDAFGDLLHTRYGAALPDEGRDYLERMRSATRRMQRLLNDLLALSRVATQAQPFVPVDLASIAREVRDELASPIQSCGARVEISDLPVVEADSAQIRQLLRNLLDNALKFHRADTPPVVMVAARIAPAGSCSPAESAGVELGQPADRCELTVEDNGIGFEARYQERIFAPFQRLHGRSQYEGSGMGLAICRRIVECHGGTITAAGRPGQGATLQVVLPIAQPASHEEP